MSTAPHFDVGSEVSGTMNPVPSSGEESPALRSDVRRWLVQGEWRTVMPPADSIARQIMEQAGVGLPERSRIEDVETDTVRASATDCLPDESEPIIASTSKRRAGHAALTLVHEQDEAFEPEALHRADLAMHVFSDPRRAEILGLVALTPDGISSVGVRQQFEQIHSARIREEIPRYVLEHWLRENGLIEADDSRRTKEGRHYYVTPEGQELLPAAGHIADWAASSLNPSPRIVLGLPQEYRLGMRDGGRPTLGRQRLELLRDIMGHAREILTAKELIERTAASETVTRTFINDLFEADWLIAVPAQVRSADDYPLLGPGKLDFTGYHSSRFSERFVAYLKDWWESRNEAVNLHELIHHRALMRREVEGGPTDFRRTVFQFVAQLASEGSIIYERPSRIPRTYLAFNPAKSVSARSLIGIIDGAAQSSPDYQADGLQKLFIALRGTK